MPCRVETGHVGAGQVSSDIVVVMPTIISSSGAVTESQYIGIRVTNGIVRQIVKSARSSGAKNATTWDPHFTVN